MLIQDKKVSHGHLWRDHTWRQALENSMTTSDVGVEAVYVDKYPDRLLDDTKVFSHYQMFGFDNRRKYITRIPKSLNGLVEELSEKYSYEIYKVAK